MTGTVKWFDKDKGFGFITCDEEHPDVFVHHSGILGKGRKNLEELQKVEFRVVQGDKGPKAVDVRALDDSSMQGSAARIPQSSIRNPQ